MTRSLGPELPSDLVRRFSHAQLGQYLGRALPLLTVDAEGFPHPMLLSYLELRALDPKTMQIVIGARSRSARNLLERQTSTLLTVESDRTIYIKARATAGPYAVSGVPDFDLFVLTVEDVLEDAPEEWEGSIRITGGLTYLPHPSLTESWARATLNALAHRQTG